MTGEYERMYRREWNQDISRSVWVMLINVIRYFMGRNRIYRALIKNVQC